MWPICARRSRVLHAAPAPRTAPLPLRPSGPRPAGRRPQDGQAGPQGGPLLPAHRRGVFVSTHTPSPQAHTQTPPHLVGRFEDGLPPLWFFSFWGFLADFLLDLRKTPPPFYPISLSFSYFVSLLLNSLLGIESFQREDNNQKKRSIYIYIENTFYLFFLSVLQSRQIKNR